VHATTDGHLLSYLVGDVFEVGLNEVGLNSVYDLKAYSRKSKASFSKKRQRPHKKPKISESSIVSR
jgi:hypothetical protein